MKKIKNISYIEVFVSILICGISFANLAVTIEDFNKEIKEYKGANPNIFFYIIVIISDTYLYFLWGTFHFIDINRNCCSYSCKCCICLCCCKCCKCIKSNNNESPNENITTNVNISNINTNISTNINTTKRISPFYSNNNFNNNGNISENSSSKNSYKKPPIKKVMKEEVMNIIFKTSKGVEKIISAPVSITVERLFIIYIKNIGLEEDAIGKKIHFLFKGQLINPKSQKKISEIFNNNPILVCDLYGIINEND